MVPFAVLPAAERPSPIRQNDEAPGARSIRWLIRVARRWFIIGSLAADRRRMTAPEGRRLMEYVEPVVALPRYDVYEENEVPVIVAAAGWVVLVFGGAWAFCKAVCGWNNVKSCSTSWLTVTATCKS
jgi:hypothetical protein